MSSDLVVQLTGKQNAPEGATSVSTGATVATLESIRAKIAARKSGDAANWQAFYHEGLGETLNIGPMSSEGYYAVENVARYAPAGTPAAGQKISDDKQDRFNRDVAYIVYGVHQPKFDRDTAVELLKAPGSGPSNTALVDAIRKLNPPHEELVGKFAEIYGLSRFLVVYLQLIREAKLVDKLLEYITASDAELVEQRVIEAAQALKKAEEAQPFFEALFQADETLRLLEIPLPRAAQEAAPGLTQSQG